MVQNRKKTSKNSHLIIYFPTSSGVSQRANGWANGWASGFLVVLDLSAILPSLTSPITPSRYQARVKWWNPIILHWEFLWRSFIKMSFHTRSPILLSWFPISFSFSSSLHLTVGQNNQESRQKYWATRSSVRLFARTAHLFACSALCCAALTCSLACSLRSLPHSRESEWLDGFFLCFLFHFVPKCISFSLS